MSTVVFEQSQGFSMHMWRADGFPIPYWDRVILLVVHMTMRSLPGTI